MAEKPACSYLIADPEPALAIIMRQGIAGFNPQTCMNEDRFDKLGIKLTWQEGLLDILNTQVYPQELPCAALITALQGTDGEPKPDRHAA